MKEVGKAGMGRSGKVKSEEYRVPRRSESRPENRTKDLIFQAICCLTREVIRTLANSMKKYWLWFSITTRLGASRYSAATLPKLSSQQYPPELYAAVEAQSSKREDIWIFKLKIKALILSCRRKPQATRYLDVGKQLK